LLAMGKKQISNAELTARALAALRREPGCQTVTSLAIYRLTEPNGSNWEISNIGLGEASERDVRRGAINVQIRLRRDYDLLPLD
jgi:hypothetical protein